MNGEVFQNTQIVAFWVHFMRVDILRKVLKSALTIEQNGYAGS